MDTSFVSFVAALDPLVLIMPRNLPLAASSTRMRPSVMWPMARSGT